MPTLNQRYKLASLDGPLDEVDLGSAEAAGALRWLTAGASALATNRLSNPAFGAATMNGAEAEADAATVATADPVVAGTIGLLQLLDRDDVVISEWTVSGPSGGGEIILTNPVIPPGAEDMAVDGFSVAHAFA